MNKNRGLTLQEGLNAVIIVGLIGLFLGFFALFNDNIRSGAFLDQTVLNESGFINQSGYLVTAFSQPGFQDFVVVLAKNATNGATISTSNYTVNATNFRIQNTTAANFNTAKFDYTYRWAGSAGNISRDLNTEFANQTDILGLVLLAVFFGIAITALLASFMVRFFGGRA